MFQTRVFALFMSLLFCQIWLRIFRMMPTLIMLVGVALILILLGYIAVRNAWQLQVYDLTLYFTAHVCGLSAMLAGILAIAYSLLGLPISQLCRWKTSGIFLKCSEIPNTSAHIEHKLVSPYHIAQK